jgi:MoaA/NifB/PqqE/SkfB family radical SAM enzyme
MREEYSPYKAVHFREQLESIKAGFQPNPVHVQIVPTNKCNSNCPKCAYRLKGYPSNETFDARDELTDRKLFEIIESCKMLGVRAIQFTGGGEPLLHPEIRAVFTKALEDTDAELSLVTNGVLLDEELCEMLSEFAWVRISVDAVLPQTYLRVRGLSSSILEKVIKNIQLLVKYKNKNTIGIGFVVFQENANEVEEAAKFYKELGVDNIRISAGSTLEGFDYHVFHLQDTIKRAGSAVRKFSDSNFTVFNNFSDRVNDLFEGEQDYDFCPVKELATYVGADCNVYTCCTLAYNRRGLIGSIENQRLEQLWDSEGKAVFFRKHNPRVNCKHPCMHMDKNKFINYCLKKKPKHAGFL